MWEVKWLDGIKELSYSLPKHATHPHCCWSHTRDSLRDYEFALCRVVCHDVSRRWAWLQSWKALVPPWFWLHSGTASMERSPCVVILSHGRVPTKLHDSRLCGKCGCHPLLWLLPDPSSSKSLTHSSALSTLTFRANHRVRIVDAGLS